MVWRFFQRMTRRCDEEPRSMSIYREDKKERYRSKNLLTDE
jgi:hypothetical protein